MKSTFRTSAPPSARDQERTQPHTLGAPDAGPATKRAPRSVDATAVRALAVRPAATKSAPRSVKRSGS